MVRCFFIVVHALDWLVGPAGPLISDAPPPGVSNLLSWSQVKILRMLGEGVTSSSDSSVAEGSVYSYDPSSQLEHSRVGTLFFFLELCRGDWLLFAICSLFWPLGVGVILRSWTSRRGGCPQGSTIMQSGASGYETCTAGALLRSGVFARSEVLALSGVLAFSGVWACSYKNLFCLRQLEFECEYVLI